ncbi:MAG: preprotein translocase subunit SecG [Planctomycetota bacterium]
MSVLTFLLSALFILCCLFLIFVVLIQKGEGGGLGGLAGGSAVDTAFGAKADMTWKRATFIAAMLFIVLSLALGVLKRPQSVTRRAATPPPAPVVPPVAPPAAPTIPNPPAHVGS